MLRSKLTYVLLLLLLSTSASASSITYWAGKNPTRHASALDACKSYTSAAVFISETSTVGRCEYPGGAGFIAQVNQVTTSCPLGDNGAFFCNASCDPPKTMLGGQCVAPTPIGGESCGKGIFNGAELGKITNSAGECVFPHEADLPSTCNHLSKATRTGLTYISFDGSGNAIDPGPIQYEGCAATPISVDHCKAPAVKAQGGVSLGPAPALCRVGLNFSGAVAGDGPVPFVPPANVGNQDGVCYPGQDCDPADLPINTSSTPCKYEWDQSIGMQVCRSTKFTGKPGDYTGCGTGPDGKFKCYGTAPSSNGIDLGTTVKTQDNPDGTTTTTKTDTHNKVVCSGIGSCTTTTTKTTQVTIKDGNGNTTGQTTTCTGANCSQTGAGGLGDSDGDGADDCQNNDTCEGGPGGPTELPELEEQPTVAETTEAYFNRIKNAPIAQALSIAVPSGGSCAAGTAQTFFGSISFDSFCQLAPNVLAGLRYLFLAIWAWAAIRLFFTA